MDVFKNDIVKFVNSEKIKGVTGNMIENPYLKRANQIGKVLSTIPSINSVRLSLVENDGSELISYFPGSVLTKLSEEEIINRGGMSPEFLRSIGMNPLTGEVVPRYGRGGGKRRKKYSKKKKKSKKKKGKSKRKRSKTRRRR